MVLILKDVGPTQAVTRTFIKLFSYTPAKAGDVGFFRK